MEEAIRFQCEVGHIFIIQNSKLNFIAEIELVDPAYSVVAVSLKWSELNPEWKSWGPWAPTCPSFTCEKHSK